MAIAFVQKSAAAVDGAANTLPVASTAGNLLVAGMELSGGTPTPPSGWTKAIGDGTNAMWIYYYENNPGGLSSFNFGTSVTQLFISEFSGVATSSSLDTTGINGFPASSPITATTSGNVSAANELAVSVGIDSESKAGTTTIGSPAGWTLMVNNGASSLLDHCGHYYLLNPTSGSTLSAQYSTSSMNLVGFGVVIAVFKLPSAIVQNSNFLMFMGPQPQQ